MILPFTFSDSFSQSTLNIHIGPSISLSGSGPYSFTIGGEDIISSAGMGFDIGIEYSYQWSDKGFGAFTSFDFIRNGVNDEYKDAAERFSDGFETTLIKLPVYVSLPLSAGLFYKYSATKALSLFFKPGATVNFMTMTDYQWDHATLESDWSTSIGYRIGIGVMYNERVSLCVDYLGLGNHELAGRRISETLPLDEYTNEVNIQLLTLTVGWNF